MLGRVGDAWAWFVGGLVDACVALADRVSGAPSWRLDVVGDAAEIVGPDGARAGRLVLVDGVARFDPPDLARRLAGASLDLAVPPSWLLRRELDPVAVQSRPFLDAFVRHQIERITPWRIGDTHYRILERPLPEDAGRLAVAVVVVPRRLAARWLAALDALHPRALRLRAAPDHAGEASIPLGGGSIRREAAVRSGVLLGLAGLALLAVGLTSTLEWQAGLLRDDIAEQNRVSAERQAVLARSRRGADPKGEAAAALRVLRDGRPMAVAIVDALSSAVPDSAHLTTLSIDKDHLVITGVSTDPSGLVPALETSGAFADVAFGAATTRVEAGGGDRFSLEMRALPPRSDHAVTPPEAGSAASPGTPRPATEARARP